MPEIFKTFFNQDRVKSALVTAFIYCLLFNSVVLAHKFSYISNAKFKAFFEIGKEFIYMYAVACMIFLGLAVSRYLFIIGTILLFITGSICSYYLFLFKISPSRYIIKAAFDSNLTELSELLSSQLIVCIILLCILIIAIIKFLKVLSWKRASFSSNVVSCLLLSLSALMIIAPPFAKLKYYFPIQYLHNSYEYFVDKNGSGLRFDISREFTFTDDSDKDIVGLLVIGETARYDHFSINGYNRETSPYLSKMPNLVNFKAKSSANLTNISVPSLLSRHPAAKLNEVWNETGMLSVLTKLGFTTSWVGTQSLRKYYKNLYSPYEEVLTNIIPGGSLLITAHSHDEVMLPFVASMLESDTQKKFIVVHTMGSHWSYEKRYPQEFARYKPECSSAGDNDHTSCNITNLINSYDNSILYTDYFLSRVIELLKNKNAFMVYVSDHGESLGENGYYGHGSEIAPSEQTTVPLMIWYSDTFRSKHQDLISAMESYQKDESISHDNVFHSVLDCLGISSEIIDKNLSLCKIK